MDMVKKFIEKITKKKDLKKEINLLDQALVSGGNFLISILITRLMGISSFGLYSAGFVLIYLFYSIHNAWVVSPMLSIKPQKEKKDVLVYSTGLLAHHLIFTAVVTLLTFVIVLLPYEEVNPLYKKEFALYLPLLTFFYLTHEFFRRSFFAEENVKKAFYCDLIAYGIQLPLVLIVCLSGSDSLMMIIVANCAGFLCSSVYGFYQSNYTFKNLKRTIIDTGIENWQFSKWLIGTSLLQWTSGNFFFVAAASLISPAAFGAINLCHKIIDGLGIVYKAIENHVVVKSSILYKKFGLTQLAVYLKSILLKGFPLIVLSAFAIGVCSKWILQVFSGDEGEQYKYILQLFAIHYVFVFIGYPFRFFALTIRKNFISFISYVLSSIFSALSAVVIISNYGATGVIIGIIVANLISIICYMVSLRKDIYLGLNNQVA